MSLTREVEQLAAVECVSGEADALCRDVCLCFLDRLGRGGCSAYADELAEELEQHPAEAVAAVGALVLKAASLGLSPDQLQLALPPDLPWSAPLLRAFEVGRLQRAQPSGARRRAAQGPAQLDRLAVGLVRRPGLARGRRDGGESGRRECGRV